MLRLFPIAIAAGCLAIGAVSAARAASPGAAPPGVMTSNAARGTISIAPEPRLVDGELILKIVALNQSRKPASFGPGNIEIRTADGRPVPILSLPELISRVKAAARRRPSDSISYNSSYVPGPATTYNQYGQPDIHNFSGSSAPLNGAVNSAASVGGSSGGKAAGAAVSRQIASLEAGILRNVTIAPGEVKGGQIVTRPIRFHWREKHTLRIQVRFNGEQHEFELPALPALPEG